MSEIITAAASLIQVILIDLALSADNAVAVGVSASALNQPHRDRAIRWGIFLALILRIGFGFLTIQLFQISGIKFIGGVLLLYISARMIIDVARTRAHLEAQAKGAAPPREGPVSFARVMFSIVIANVALSFDNVIAVAAVSSNVWIMAIGLILSVLLMGVAASLIARIIDRHRWIAWLGILVIIIAGVMMIWEDGNHFRPDLVPPPPAWTGGIAQR